MDDNSCQICLGNSNTNLNSLYSCSNKGCNIKVHKGCYGINGNDPWICQRCQEYGRSIDKSCDLCPISKGPIKKSLKAGWVHIICTLYVPEAYFLKPEFLEKLSYSQTALQDSKNKHCYLCLENQRQDHAQKGLKILCQHEGCKVYFHATCGLNAKNLTEEINEPSTSGNGKMLSVNYIGYCNQHRLQHKKGGALEHVAFNSPPNVSTLYAKIPARYKRTQESTDNSNCKGGPKALLELTSKEPKNSHKESDSLKVVSTTKNSSPGTDWMKGRSGSIGTLVTGCPSFGENNVVKSGAYKIPKRKSEPNITEKLDEKIGSKMKNDDSCFTAKKGSSSNKESTSSSESGCGSHNSKQSSDQNGKKDKCHQGPSARSSSYNPTSGTKKSNSSSSTSKSGIVISSDYFLAGTKNYLSASSSKTNENGAPSQSSDRKSNPDSARGLSAKDRDKQHTPTTPSKSNSSSTPTTKSSPAGKTANLKGSRGEDSKETSIKSSKSLSSQGRKPAPTTSTEQRRALASDIARKIVCSSGGGNDKSDKGKINNATPVGREEVQVGKKQGREGDLDPAKGSAKRVKVENVEPPTTSAPIVVGKKSTIPLLIKPLEVGKGVKGASVDKVRTLSEGLDDDVASSQDDTISSYFAKYRRFKSGPSPGSSIACPPASENDVSKDLENSVKASDILEETKIESSSVIDATPSDVSLIASPSPYSLNLIPELATENEGSVSKPLPTLKTVEPEVCKGELEADGEIKPNTNPALTSTESHSISDILSKTSPLPQSNTPLAITDAPITCNIALPKEEVTSDAKVGADKITFKPVAEIMATPEPEIIDLRPVTADISEIKVEKGIEVVTSTKDLPLHAAEDNLGIKPNLTQHPDNEREDVVGKGGEISKIDTTGPKVVANPANKPVERECDSEEVPQTPFSPPQQQRSTFQIPPSALPYPSSYDHQGLVPPIVASLPYPHPLRYDPYLFNMATAMFGSSAPSHPNPGPSYFDSASAYHLSWAANAYAAGLFGNPLLAPPTAHYPTMPGPLQQPELVGAKDDYLSPKQQHRGSDNVVSQGKAVGKVVVEEKGTFLGNYESSDQTSTPKSSSHHKARPGLKGNLLAGSSSSVVGKSGEGKKPARVAAVTLHAEQQHLTTNIQGPSSLEQHESPPVASHGGAGVKRKASAPSSTPAQSRALASTAAGSAKKRQQQLSRVQETIAAVAAAISTTPPFTPTTTRGAAVTQGASPQVGKAKTLAALKPSVTVSSNSTTVMDESDNSTVSLEDPGAQRSTAKQAPSSSLHQQHFISKELNPALLAGIGMPYLNEGAVKGMTAPGGRAFPTSAYYGLSSDAAETNSLARMEFISTHAAYMLAPSLMLSNNRIPSYSDVLTMTTNTNFLNNPQYMASREKTQSILNPGAYASGLKIGQAPLNIEPRSRSFSLEGGAENGSLASPNSAIKKTIAPETWENVIQAHVDSFMRTVPGEKASFDLNTFLQSLAAQVDENKVNEAKLTKLRLRAGQLALENAQLSERLNALLGPSNQESVHSTLSAPPVIS